MKIQERLFFQKQIVNLKANYIFRQPIKTIVENDQRF